MNAYTFKLLIIFICLAVAGCGPSNEDHIYEIGKKYTLTTLTLTFNNGSTFRFTQTELDALTDDWFMGNADIQTINNIMQNGMPLDYQFELSDGFEMAFDGNLLEINGTHYLYLALLGDGGGFTGDVISHALRLDPVLDTNRLEELFELAADTDKTPTGAGNVN